MYLMACRECDLLSQIPNDVVATFRCSRCRALLHRAIPGRLNASLAYSLAACILFLIANVFPIISIEAAGIRTNATLFGAVLALMSQDRYLVALLVLITTVVIPMVELTCSSGLLILARTRRFPATIGFLFRARSRLLQWSMVEIFLLGALVAITRLGSLANITLGIGIWSIFGYMVLNAASVHTFDAIDLWEQAKQC
jgi:paraquat-inducible protein A